jgi:periplasmic protein TonB
VILKALNPNSIKSISVNKTPVIKNGKKYSSTIFVNLNEQTQNNLPPLPPPPPNNDNNAAIQQEEEIMTKVDQQTVFPGGASAMYEYLGANIKYPNEAQKKNISGKVFLKFVVKKDGSIGDVEVLKGIGYGCDEESVRVVKAMPKWRPAKYKGKNVACYFNMPIVYKLD